MLYNNNFFFLLYNIQKLLYSQNQPPPPSPSPGGYHDVSILTASLADAHTSFSRELVTISKLPAVLRLTLTRFISLPLLL